MQRGGGASGELREDTRAQPGGVQEKGTLGSEQRDDVMPIVHCAESMETAM